MCIMHTCMCAAKYVRKGVGDGVGDGVGEGIEPCSCAQICELCVLNVLGSVLICCIACMPCMCPMHNTQHMLAPCVHACVSASLSAIRHAFVCVLYGSQAAPLGRVGVGVVGAGVGGLGEAVGVGAVGVGVGGGGSIWTCVVVLGMHLTYSDMC